MVKNLLPVDSKPYSVMCGYNINSFEHAPYMEFYMEFAPPSKSTLTLQTSKLLALSPGEIIVINTRLLKSTMQ